MILLKRKYKWGIIGLIIFVAMVFVGVHSLHAVPLVAPVPAVPAIGDNWVPLPPYNLLWPLWSPALSPPDPVTGIPTPLLTSLTRNTFLPVEPVLFWDPVIRDIPYILYNIPQPLGGGMVFFDQYFGLNPWPPSYLIDPITGLPAPIDLPVGFAALSPTVLDPFADYVTWANLYFLAQYPPGLFATSISNLLTSAEIWGLPPL